MYPINDREYLKICASIASEMSISLSSAKKKVEIQISQNQLKTIEEKRALAEDILKICKSENLNGTHTGKLFDELMESLNNDDNFLVED
tara:strand:- start:1572 stop:1838 length:267 start_codon:yes stop_codon:yes gene_type:complete